MRSVRSIVIALVGLAFVVGAPGRAGAQTLEQPRARQGYYVGFGGGVEVEASSNDGESQTFVGSGYGLRLGQMLTPSLGLGVRVDFGGAADGEVTAGGGGLLVEGQLQLWRDLAVQAGFGFGFASLRDPAAVDNELTGGYGALGLLGVSYDWFFTSRLTGGWAVTPNLAMRALSGGEFDAVWFTAGVQVTWWSGRPRHELELPEGAAYR